MIRMNKITQASTPKEASEQFITLWCHAIVDEKSCEFEKEWGLVLETPKKNNAIANFNCST